MKREKSRVTSTHILGESEFLQQVGKTVSGKPISHDQFMAILLDIYKGLDLNKTDIVLDMCCGNGLVTAEIAKKCNSIIGIDHSDSLVKIAKEYYQPENITYYQGSILDPGIKTYFLNVRPFTKILMYEALQHFTEDDLATILEITTEISTPNVVIFWGSIPDKDKIWDFYDTDEKREMYQIRKSRNEEKIRNWWDKKIIEKECLRNGYKIQFLAQNPILHSAYYRFDVQLSKNA
jgi:cyclopropane fatty-acyl-phospholipid synthase-like methyltransferase